MRWAEESLVLGIGGGDSSGASYSVRLYSRKAEAGRRAQEAPQNPKRLGTSTLGSLSLRSFIPAVAQRAGSSHSSTLLLEYFDFKNRFY
jgi:hypothetical protein